MDFTDPGFPQYHGFRGGASNLHIYIVTATSRNSRRRFIILRKAPCKQASGAELPRMGMRLTTAEGITIFLMKQLRKTMEEKQTTDRQIIPTSQVLPPKLNVLPMTGTPVFPGIFTPLMVTGGREVESVSYTHLTLPTN